MKIITTHKNTDFDALASLVAASLLYPDATPLLPKTVNPNVKQFLSIHKDIFSFPQPDEIDLDTVETLVVVDVNCWSRLEHLNKLSDRSSEIDIILWDHHGLAGDIDARVQHVEEMGANTTLMIRELRQRKCDLTPIQATLFLAGIYEDTGNLMFPSTRAEDAYAVGYLLKQGRSLGHRLFSETGLR